MAVQPIFLVEKTLDSMWFSLLASLYESGRINKITAGSFEGSKRLEFDFVAGTIMYPTIRPLAPIMPEGVPPVTTDEDIEKYFVNYIMDGRLAKNEHYKYATWIAGGRYKMPRLQALTWRIHDEYGDISEPQEIRVSMDGQSLWVPNQVEWAIKHYKERGFGNNHCYIQVGYPESSFAYDIPYKHETERQTSPCLRGIDTKILEDDGKYKLCFHAYFRSWDLWGAWPENMGGITMLMEYMAEELSIETGSLSFSAIKLHCYDFQIKSVEARLHK